MKLISDPQLVVVWRLTGRCNSNCHFCSYSLDVGGLRENARSDDICRFGDVLSAYQKEFNKKVLISWIGGEPLLWPELESVSHHLKEKANISLGLTTNGLLLSSKKVRELLLKYYDEVTVSLDGLKDFHDWCRGGSGQFEKICSGLKQLNCDIEQLPRPVKLKANTILMRGNIHHFEELCSLLASLGIKELTFNQLGGVGRPEFYPKNRLLPEQVERFCTELPRIRTTFASRGLTISGSAGYLERIKATTAGRKLAIEDCNPGQSFLSINEMGTISPCDGTTEEYKIDSKEIQTPSDVQLITQTFRQMRSNFKSKKCEDCHCTQVHGKFAHTKAI